MKKYLMMGLAALALASCSKDEVQYVDSDIAKYETAFVNTFGQPSPTQTWGFGTTRGITRSAYPNANQWASQGYTVPDPLKPGQKARVQFFFQTKKNPGGTKDFGQIDFFVQQVYDGATDPITDAKYGYSSTDYSTERYLAADQINYIESGAHMDHLTAGSDNEHIYNFNNGTCSTNKNVGDNGADLDTKQHSDEIMLMLNTKTDKFGYANSDASYVRTDRYNLVSGADIDQYIADNKAAYDAWLAQHEGITDAIVDDDWHRSFIGFDFDQLPDKNVFINYSETKNEYGVVTSVSMDYATWTGPGYERYYWDGEKMVETHTVDENWNWSVKEGYEVMTWKGKKVPMVSANNNQYCGDKKSFSDDTDIMIEKDDATYGKHKCLNMEVLGPLIEQGYLPCSSTLKDWVQVGGCADGYYSDWIVSFMPATPTDPKEPGEPEETVYDLRVMAEDLTIVGDVAKTDFDFNDVVFDAVLVKNASNEVTGAKIRLLAAGGTLPLRIGGAANNKEVHDLFKVGTNTMVNTINDGTATYKTRVKPVEFEISGNWATIKDIPVEVQKNGVWKLIFAEQGQPASKFGCPVGTDWCDEWQHIDTKWSGKFTEWVNDETKPFWEDLKVNW